MTTDRVPITPVTRCDVPFQVLNIVSVLCDNASNYVPKHHVNFYKFWWSQELSCLKEKAIISDKLWKDAGRPRSGPLFSRRSSDKRAYKSANRSHESDCNTM